ncbi:hemerythrin domain-containing protein [Brevibacillus reuszeri]|uniref:hemerythrin domain-containing protein n=1 Tax=Brevibacillus reuszeri TaxID=54915 RepID=UPI001F46A8A9|nr:hemerythrin domain-containing protein [Brevibacillus reuszeri]
MEQQHWGCMGMMQVFRGGKKLCPPLQKLKEEHRSLGEKINRLAGLAKELGQSAEPSCTKRLTELHEIASSFLMELDKHFRCEEERLFPILGGYIGRDMGPIAVMEYEHRQAKEHISLFLRLVEKGRRNEQEEITTALHHLRISVEILLQHFFKEENVLLPMADHLLSDADKAQLQRLFQDGVDE